MITPQPLAPAPVSAPSVGVSVNTGGSTLVGKLSVPPAWTAASQVANHSGVTYAGGGWTNAVGPTGGGCPEYPEVCRGQLDSRPWCSCSFLTKST